MISLQRTKSVAVLLLALLFTVVNARADEVAKAGQFQLRDLSDRPVDPFAQSEIKTLVFLFVRTDCPISNRYAPEVKRLYQKFAARHTRFFLIYPGADESVATIKQHISDYGYPFDALRDVQQQLVKLTGAQVTPEAAVFVRDKENFQLRYRGRIDDRVAAFGKMRAAPTTRDLEQTLEAIRKGKTTTPRTTTAIGCFIAKNNAS